MRGRSPLGILAFVGAARIAACEGAGDLDALRLDGFAARVSAQACGASGFCLDSVCVAKDSLAAWRLVGEDDVAFRRRAARLLMEKGKETAAVTVLAPLVRLPGIPDSVRLELASALFFSGRYEEGLGFNYAMDSLRGPIELAVLNQRREFFQLLDMNEEAAKFEERRLDVELRTLPKPRPFWLPRLTVATGVGYSRLTQDADPVGLTPLLDQWSQEEGTKAGMSYSDALLNQSLSQGNSQSVSGGLKWNYEGSAWGAELRGGGSRNYAGQFSSLTEGDLLLHSYQFSAGTSMNLSLGAMDWSADLDWIRKQYVSSGRWWSQALQGSLQASRQLGGGVLWASAGLGQHASASFPDGYLSWQGGTGYTRQVPGWSWMTLGLRSGIEMHRLPNVTTDAARISWAEGLAPGKSNLDGSIVHYKDSTGSAVDPVDPFFKLTYITYHSGRSILQEREVYSQYSPSLGLDLRLALPWQLGLRGGFDVTWTRSMEKVALSNTQGAASENGELLVWIDRKTGQDYIFASSTGGSTLEVLQVQETVRQDLTRTLSSSLSWSPSIWGTFSAGMSWSWGDVEPYAIDPASRYTSWGWNLGWSRTW